MRQAEADAVQDQPPLPALCAHIPPGDSCRVLLLLAASSPVARVRGGRDRDQHSTCETLGQLEVNSQVPSITACSIHASYSLHSGRNQHADTTLVCRTRGGGCDGSIDMPCVILRLKTQHSDLIEAAQYFARTAWAEVETWPGELSALRQMLARHDRMEQDALYRLGVAGQAEALAGAFDQLLESRASLGAKDIAAMARMMVDLVEDHAKKQEGELFPILAGRQRLRTAPAQGALHRTTARKAESGQEQALAPRHH